MGDHFVTANSKVSGNQADEAIQIFDDGVDAYGLNPKDNDLNFAFSKEVMTDILQSMTS